MRLALCAILALSACYAPTVISGVPCDPEVAGACPIGQTCQLSGSSHVCAIGGPSASDAGVDTPLMAGCYGAGMLGPLCFDELTEALTITTARSINTAMVGGVNCTAIRAQKNPGGPSICIVAASSIEIVAGVTVRAIGANPLVLVAARTIKIDGTLDVASHASSAARPALAGPGARTAVECNATGVDGAIGNDAGGGGGAGGSFGGRGAQGGNGNTGAQRGVPAPLPADPTAVLIGGCGGGRGGDGYNLDEPTPPPFGSGPGGLGGGAVYLLAGDSITVSASGSINASGAGGEGGTDGLENSGGGGGGGAGGMIGLDARQMTITGAVYANGGGGGGGGGGNRDQHGQAGADPTRPDSAAVGGAGGLDVNDQNRGGGDGGLGAFRTNPAGNGGNAASTDSAGAGGGGGIGLIKVYGVSLPLPGGTFSPSPTT